MNDNIKISKSFTGKEWKEMRPHLLNSNDRWQEAIQIFEDRVDSRFFNPIGKIKLEGKNEGEGFSIALISVVLLELLAAFELGKIYRINKEGLSPSEYNSGSRLLKSFLNDSKIFNSHFETNSKIQNFYENIRCGFVHEARTLKNDVIISGSSVKNTQNQKIYFKEDGEYRLNRDLLISKIKEHIEHVKNKLIENDNATRKNFILKMDEITGLKHVWYFIYGSNLLELQLERRLKELNEVYLRKERCSLEGYKFIYNKESIDGTSKGNIFEKENGIVQGIAILLLENNLDEFIKRWEFGYTKLEVNISCENIFNNNEKMKFKGYTCISNIICSLSPSKEYVSKIIEGANENYLPNDYISTNFKYLE